MAMQRPRERSRPGAPGTGLRRLRAVTVALVLGAVAVAGCSKGDDATAAPAVPTIPAPSGANAATAFGEELPPPDARTSPTEAVNAYLDAELRRDLGASFAVLSSDDRAAIGGVEPWIARHAQLPEYTGFEVEGESSDGAVTATVTATPRLDEVVGYIPASARVVFPTVNENDGWTVALSGILVEPVLPSDSAAISTAEDWVRAATDGAATTPFEYDGNLLGQPEVVGALGQFDEGSFAAGAVTPIDDWPHATVISNAFGPNARKWTRVVPVNSPAPLDVVTAPLGDEWRVVGVVAR